MSDAKGFFQRASIPVPDLSLEGLRSTCVALKEAVDVMMGQRGVAAESVIVRRDLIITGLITNPEYPFTVPPRSDYMPGLGFGGPPLDTGIAYATDYPRGRWLRVGSLVFFTAAIVLTSKGTATGVASITLPYPARQTPAGFWICPTRLANVTGVADVMGRIQPDDDNVVFHQMVSTGNPVQITDANFTNTSDLRCTGFYEAFIETTDSETDALTKRRQ
jgi:hypothetical protein